MTLGNMIGPYMVLDPLGSGGMGEVYRARDTRLGREVALKRLVDTALSTDVARRRLLREARAAAALSHPNIATIYDVLDTPEGLIIVMEYVPGETLAARLRHGALSVEEAVRFATQIADALAEAHEHGVIHRDLKPANIHVTPGGKAKILDFGIARFAREAQDDHPTSDEAATEAGRIVGTLGYMAPEQLAASPGDQRTDIYAAGVVLFEMLTGRRPFEAADMVGNALAVFEGRALRVSDVAPHVPAELTAIVVRAMARKPEDRFSTARELSRALEAAAARMNEARTIAADESQGLSNGRWDGDTFSWRIAAAVLGLLSVAVIAGIWMRGWWSPPVSAHSSVVAVLPFQNHTGQQANDAVVVGLNAAIANRLGSIPSLRVLPLDETRDAAQNTPDATRAVRSLGAAFVVEGALRRTGEALELDVFLVANDGRRRPAGRYTASATSPFDVHRRVAEGLTAALNQEGVIRAAETPAPALPTSNQEAFADYAQGRLFLERPDVPGNLDHAIRLFQSAVLKDSRFALAHAGLGEAYWAQYRETNDSKWTTKATTAILDALRIDPAQPEVRMSLAVMYQGLGRRDEALAELRQVLALQPHNDNAHRIRASIHAGEGDWVEAIDEAQKAIELRPTYWRNHAELGDTLFRAGRLNEAMKAYMRVIELQPDSARGYQRLGTALHAAGDLSGAVENYEKATAIRPSWGAYSNVGTLHYWRGDYTKAVDAYERALTLAPNQPDLYANLGDAWRRLGRNERAAANYRLAIEHVEKLLTVKENDAANLARLALYQAKLGQHRTAAANVQKALALNPQDGEVLFVRTVVHALAGETAAGCGALTEALARGASVEVIRHADELRPLTGCTAYERTMGRR